MKALVIDDSRAVRLLLASLLRKLGFEVVEAANGREGVARLKEQAFGLALVDWNMPEMNGCDFVRVVRADKTFDQVRLLMVTSESDLDHVSRALEAGANEYVMKPFTRESIQEKVALLGCSPSAP
jgi:two-component system, chemotaxis family, chemotaxis protein CheY